MRALPLVLSLALLGCDPGFRPETLVSDLRLLGIRAEPAELHPGESAQLSALVLDPARTGSSVLWVGCAADPYVMNRSPCSNTAVLSDPSALTGGTGTLPEGVQLIGFDDQASYRAPADLFAPLPADDARRQSGTVGLVIAFAVAETINPGATQEELAAVFGRVQRNETKAIVALFRITISESDSHNQNPGLERLVVANERWPRDAHVLLREREPVLLDALAADGSFERYAQLTPEGVVEKTERLLVAWYSSAGRFTQTSTALGEDVRTIFRAPGTEADPVPQKRTGTFFTVVRDTRGGNGWRSWPFFVCDDTAPSPSVISVDWPSGPTQPVVLHGSGLEAVVDVVVDDAALEDGAYSAADGVWRGYLPADVTPGTRRGTVLTARCTRVAL